MAAFGLSGIGQAPSEQSPGTQTDGPARWRDRAGWQNAAAALLLALACAALLGTALLGGWRADDGPHLDFVTQYAPWQYFFVPEVMLQQSYAHITPWNALFYEIGLPFFRLQPEGHYVHLLAVLWLAALATFVLLRHWLAWAPALAGAVLFLAMPATGAVARLLMTGHYAYGLLFSVLALIAFARAARQGSLTWGLLAALAYALACLCKELYVPLVAVLLCWPEGSARARLRIAAPVLVVALAYAVWRLWLLKGAGGYAETETVLNPHDVWLSLKYLRDRAVGPDWAGWVATGSALVLFVMGWTGRGVTASVCLTTHAQRWRWILFFGAWITVLILPLGGLLLSGRLENTSGRLLLFIGWVVAVALAFILPTAWQRKRSATALMLASLVATLALGERQIGKQIALSQDVRVQQNRLLVSGQPGAFITHQYLITGYMRSMARAVARLQGSIERVIVQDEEETVALGSKAGAEAWMYAPDCHCVRRLGLDYALLVADFTDRVALGSKRSATVKAHLSLEGARQKVLRWEIHDTSLQTSELSFYIHDSNQKFVPVKGSFVFGLDTTLNLKEVLLLRLSFKFPDGALVRSPLLSFPLDRPSEVYWSGADLPVKKIMATEMP